MKKAYKIVWKAYGVSREAEKLARLYLAGHAKLPEPDQPLNAPCVISTILKHMPPLASNP